MKYLLFAGVAYYPSGGWDDFVGAFDSIDEAKKATPPVYVWAHIVDASTRAIVLYGDGQEPMVWKEPS